MSVKRVTPDEAAKLLEQGWKYVDVRSIPEFNDSHPTGAYNVPLMHRGPGGMRPNTDFMAVVKKSFGTADELVIGCRTGRRSLQAAEMMIAEGYVSVVDMQGGLVGETDAAGNVICRGWAARDLPVSSEAVGSRCYEQLQEA